MTVTGHGVKPTGLALRGVSDAIPSEVLLSPMRIAAKDHSRLPERKMNSHSMEQTMIWMDSYPCITKPLWKLTSEEGRRASSAEKRRVWGAECGGNTTTGKERWAGLLERSEPFTLLA